METPLAEENPLPATAPIDGLPLQQQRRWMARPLIGISLISY
jgi:hypothetical protein